MSQTEMDNLMEAIEGNGLSRNQLVTLLQNEEEKSRHYKKKLHNYYSKFSRHSKQHQLILAEHTAEIKALKIANQKLLAENASVQKWLDTKNTELASKDEELQKTLSDCKFFEMLLSHRDQTNDQLEKKNNNLQTEIEILKSKLNLMDSSE